MYLGARPNQGVEGLLSLYTDLVTMDEYIAKTILGFCSSLLSFPALSLGARPNHGDEAWMVPWIIYRFSNNG